MSSGDNIELRDAIARELCGSVLWAQSEPSAKEFYAQRMADRILTLPEIAEALKELHVKQRIEAHFAGTRGERYRVVSHFEF